MKEKKGNQPVHCPIQEQHRWRLFCGQSCSHRRHKPSWTCFSRCLPPFTIDFLQIQFQTIQITESKQKGKTCSAVTYITSIAKTQNSSESMSTKHKKEKELQKKAISNGFKLIKTGTEFDKQMGLIYLSNGSRRSRHVHISFPIQLLSVGFITLYHTKHKMIRKIGTKTTNKYYYKSIKNHISLFLFIQSSVFFFFSLKKRI